jgi:flagellar biosynthesis/type III secretory pathway chaperone
MASKKGIAITVIILAAITGASFLLWIVPENNETTFVVSDYENYLDEVKNIHEVLQELIDIEYQNLRDGKISPEEYIAISEVTSSQVTAKISEFVTSKPTEEWQGSYISYMDAMKKFNEYIVETEVLANLIENEVTENEIAETMEKIESLKTESIKHANISDELRPD